MTLHKAATMAGLLALAVYMQPESCNGDEVLDAKNALQSLQSSDSRLNQTYRVLMTRLDPADQASLKSVQRSWIAFKEADFAIFEKLVLQTGFPSQSYRYQNFEVDAQATSLSGLEPPHPHICDSNEPAQADQVLNKIYRQLMSALPSDLMASEKTAQVSWIRFRDLYCQFDATLKGGTPDNETLRDLTKRRAEELQAHLARALKIKFPVAESDRPEDPVDEQPTDLPMADPFRFAK